MRDLTRDLAVYGHYLLETTPAVTAELEPIRVILPAGATPETRRRFPAWAVAAIAVAVSVVAILLFRGAAGTEPIPFVDGAPTTVVGPPPVPTEASRGDGVERVVSLLPGNWGALSEYSALPSPPSATCQAPADPAIPGRRDQARPPPGTGMGQHAAFDAESGVFVYSSPDGDVWHFHVCSNRWLSSAVTAPPGIWSLAYDVDSDRVIGFDASSSDQGRVWVYDTNRESAIVRSAQGRLHQPTSPVYDPPSGLVILGDDRIVAYDVDTDTWVEIGSGIPSDATLTGYDSASNRLVFSSAFGDTALIDPRTGEMTQPVDSAAPPLLVGFPPVFPLTASGSPSPVFHDLGGGAIVRFDSSEGRWVTIYDEFPFSAQPPGVRTYDGIVWDGINVRLIGFGGSERVGFEWQERDDVWAIDLDSGEVRQLVPESENP